MSWCSPRSFDYYQDIVDKLSDRIDVIGFGSGVKEDLGGIMLDAEEPFNEEMYSKFRNSHCSYDYLLQGK